jgi:hypothetical protein
MEDMMNETIFNLLLTGEGGVALFGTLRFAVADTAPPVAAALPVALGAPQPLGLVTVGVYPLQGSLSIPLLTGFGRVPLTGALLVTPAAGLAYVMSGGEPGRQAILKFNNIDGARIAGGVQWRYGDAGASLVLSFLGTRLLLPF